MGMHSLEVKIKRAVMLHKQQVVPGWELRKFFLHKGLVSMITL